LQSCEILGFVRCETLQPCKTLGFVRREILQACETLGFVGRETRLYGAFFLYEAKLSVTNISNVDH